MIPLVNSVLKGKNSVRLFYRNSLPIEIKEDYSILLFTTVFNLQFVRAKFVELVELVISMLLNLKVSLSGP